MTHLSHGEQIRRNKMFVDGFLWCNFCKEFKTVKNFYPNRGKDQRTNFGYRRYCIECEYSHRNPQAKKQFHKEKNYRLKKQFAELAGGRCQRCGYDEFVTAMDFHHVYPSEKKYSPAILIFRNNFKRTWKELDKCCLLCASCHAAYTANEWRAEFIKRDGLGWTVGESLPLDDGRYEKKPEKVRQTPLPLHLMKSGPKQLELMEITQ